jgi:hypothetical protein
VFAVLLAAQAPTPVRVEQGAQQALEQRYAEHVRFLAAPEMEGRGAGTAGLEKASAYIGDQFKRFGLQPVGDKRTYQQALSVTTGAEPGKNNAIDASGKALRFRDDFVPISFSSNGKVTAPVVFAGYGVTAPELHHDDYAHLDVKGKIVVVMRYEPKNFVKSGKEQYTHHAHLVNKAINARNRGARALLLVDASGEKDELIEFGKIAGPDDAGILMLQVKRSVVEEWLKAAGKSLASDPSSLPETFRPTVQVDVERKQAQVTNVLGYLPGRSKEYIVIGAHYDHIGSGGQSSLAPGQTGKVHPGADDNASGTAALIELARTFSQRRTELDRGILFAAFAGEELGLLGSAHWVKNPTMPLENAVAMLNMDMVGRINGSKLYIGGIGSGSTFDAVVKEASAKHDFTVDASFQGTSSSDHASFISKNIPSLFFFSGLHGDYHKPTDTADKINVPAAAKVVNVVADVAAKLVASGPRPQFARVRQSHGAGGDGASSGGSGGGYGPYFGVVPDFAPLDKGVRFADISPGSPAEAAGLKAGDVLTDFGDKPIANLYDLTYALRASKVGDAVKVKVLRDGKEVSVDVKLAARK